MNNFKAIRERIGLSQSEIAKSLGCSQGNISFYEKGQAVKPEVAKKLINLAASRGFAVTYEDIYGSPSEIGTAPASREEAA